MAVYNNKATNFTKLFKMSDNTSKCLECQSVDCGICKKRSDL